MKYKRRTGTLDTDRNTGYGQEHRIRTGMLDTSNKEQEPGSLTQADTITDTE